MPCSEQCAGKGTVQSLGPVAKRAVVRVDPRALLLQMLSSPGSTFLLPLVPVGAVAAAGDACLSFPSLGVG